MSTQQPIILTSKQSGKAENDCACAQDYRILCGENLSNDDDCACSIAASHISTISSAATALVMAPNLYRHELHHQHEIVFNPFGISSLAVLNEPARQILDAFSKPQSIQELHTHFPDYSSEKTSAVVSNLLQSGLLVSAAERNKFSVKPSPDTLTAWLHITNACNLRCDYCYIQKTPEKLELDRGKQAVEAVFRSALANGFRQVKLKYAGGEPTLNFPLVLELHRYARLCAHQAGIDLKGVVLSNGAAISEKMIDGLKECGLALSISLDGIDHVNDSQRKFADGRGTFGHIEHSLERLAARDLTPSITITISNRNLQGLPKTIEYVLNHHLPFTINFYRENGWSTTFSDLAYTNERLIQAMKEAFSVIEANLPHFSLLGCLTDRARLDYSHDQPCGVGNSYLVIDQNGKVAKCHMDIEKSVTSISAADPLKEILLSSTGIQNLPVDEREGCRDCSWRYWCAGGCPALTYRITGRYDVKSPNCDIYKALFPEVLRMEGLRLLKNAEEKIQ